MEIFDWLVLAAYALLMLGVGAFYSRQNKTADDYLLRCAVLEKDFLSSRPGFSSSDAETVSRLKWLTWLVSAIAIALSMLNLLFVGNLVERCFKLINLLTAPLFVLFFLALFVPWANAFGAWLGLLTSIATAVSIAYANDLGLPLTISFVWIIPCSLLVGVTVGTVASVLRPNHPKGVPSDVRA